MTYRRMKKIGVTLLGMTLATLLTPQKGLTEVTLLPAPKSYVAAEGVYSLSGNIAINIPSNAAGLRLATDELIAALAAKNVTSKIANDSKEATINLTVIDNPINEGVERDGYLLTISSSGITIEGNSEAGLFYGITSLRHLVLNAEGNTLKCATIKDVPDFPNRGFYHDITRGKVPTLDTMKLIVDFLADHKMNQFQLYVEHTFAFSFNPAIAQNPDALTAEEVKELDQYCKDRYIDLVPSLQAFGHMAGVLSLPEYRHLAEVEITKPWDDLTWNERMAGATIDTTNPDARALLKQMLDEYLPLFDSKFVNVCADETYDVAKGKSKEYAESIGGAGHLYLEHIKWLNEVCKSHGKRMMFWGDIVKQHPELIPEIPKDTILLDWGYFATTDFDSSKLFQDAGLDFYVCPGVSGWNDILNRIDNADLNIRRFADAGKKYGALGLLNTDWGDHGHYNLLAGSWHGAALGGAMSWHTGTPDKDGFDSQFSSMYFNDPSAKGIKALRELSFELGIYASWKCFYAPFTDLDAIKKVSDEKAAQLKAVEPEALEIFSAYKPNAYTSAQDLAEYRHMIQMMGLLGEKIQLARLIASGNEDANLKVRLQEFASALEARYAEYETLWRARNKESELALIGVKFKALIDEARTLAQ